MFRKTVTTLAAAAVIATASLTATTAAEASSTRDRIIAGVALGVAAGLLGAEIHTGQKAKGHHSQGKKGNKGHKKAGFGKTCEDVPVFGGKKGNRLIAMQRVCH